MEVSKPLCGRGEEGCKEPAGKSRVSGKDRNQKAVLSELRLKADKPHASPANGCSCNPCKEAMR